MRYIRLELYASTVFAMKMFARYAASVTAQLPKGPRGSIGTRVHRCTQKRISLPGPLGPPGVASRTLAP